MWLIAYGLFVSFLHHINVPLYGWRWIGKAIQFHPSPPALDTAAASSADVHVPIGARMTGTSISNKSQRGCFQHCVTELHSAASRGGGRTLSTPSAAVAEIVVRTM